MPTPPAHPATLPLDKLRAQCETRRLRRSGPGGQHRNKVETAVAITHLPTGVAAEANERRSQAQNAEAALHRLRVRLALAVRSAPSEDPSELWARRAVGGLRVDPAHNDFPALLAEALDHLAANAWDDRVVAGVLKVSRSGVIRLLRNEPAALKMLNQHRAEAGLGPLN